VLLIMTVFANGGKGRGNIGFCDFMVWIMAADTAESSFTLLKALATIKTIGMMINFEAVVLA
jgi:hypothetical protein